MSETIEVKCDVCGKSYNAVTPFELEIGGLYAPCKYCGEGDLRKNKYIRPALNVEIECDECHEVVRDVSPFDLEKGELLRPCTNDGCNGDMHIIKRWY